jgi:transposase, IS5 family
VDNFISFIFQEEYSKIQELGDTLSNIGDFIDWEPFRSIIFPLYKDNHEDGRRPHFDEILMVKVLVLQHLYGLSDYEIERHIYDRISFRQFPGDPDATFIIVNPGHAKANKPRGNEVVTRRLKKGFGEKRTNVPRHLNLWI